MRLLWLFSNWLMLQIKILIKNVAAVAAAHGAEPSHAGGTEERRDVQRSPRLLRQLDEYKSQRGDRSKLACYSDVRRSKFPHREIPASRNRST
jgi:hypothetical protein